MEERDVSMQAAETDGTTATSAAPPPEPAPASRRRQGPSRLMRIVEAYAMVGIVAAMIVFFSLFGPSSAAFPTTANLQAVLGGQAVLAIVTLAALVPLVCYEFDLSVGSILALSAVMSASAYSSGAPLVVGILVGIGIGLLVGLVNGLIITRGGVNAVVTTLGTSTIIAGLITWKTGGQAIVQGIPGSLTAAGSGNTLGIPRPILFMAVVAGLVYYLLQHTPLGRYLDMAGSNPPAARLVGLDTKRLTLTAFLLSGVLSGVAGVLQVARDGAANPGVGDAFTLPALAAAFLGFTAVRPGRFNVGGTLVAIAFLATLNSGLNLSGADPYVNSIVNGLALIVGVALTGLLWRRRAGRE